MCIRDRSNGGEYMFRKNMAEPNPYYFEGQMLDRLYYEIDSLNRKTKNLNNRLKRVESFLGLRPDERYEPEIQYND